jgi:pimeloyl-ACP methyl ester carboxylesterase
VNRKALGIVLGVITLLPLANLILGIHPPTFKTLDDPGHYGLRYEQVSFPTSDGLTLSGWFIPAAADGSTGKKATILVGLQFFFLPGPTKWPLVALTKLYARLLLGVDIGTAAPAQVVRELAMPLLLIHGEKDSQIPAEHGQQIYEQADHARTELWLVPNADHGQAHAIEGERYEIRVSTFLERHLSGPAT